MNWVGWETLVNRLAKNDVENFGFRLVADVITFFFYMLPCSFNMYNNV